MDQLIAIIVMCDAFRLFTSINHRHRFPRMPHCVPIPCHCETTRSSIFSVWSSCVPRTYCDSSYAMAHHFDPNAKSFHSNGTQQYDELTYCCTRCHHDEYTITPWDVIAWWFAVFAVDLKRIEWNAQSGSEETIRIDLPLFDWNHSRPFGTAIRQRCFASTPISALLVHCLSLSIATCSWPSNIRKIIPLYDGHCQGHCYCNYWCYWYYYCCCCCHCNCYYFGHYHPTNWTLSLRSEFDIRTKDLVILVLFIWKFDGSWCLHYSLWSRANIAFVSPWTLSPGTDHQSPSEYSTLSGQSICWRLRLALDNRQWLNWI